MSKRYEIDGKRWMRIGDAARMLRTNGLGIRAMMADGRLDWRQSQANSKTFVVDEAAVMAMLRAMPLAAPSKPKSRDRTTTIADGGRRVRGGLWIDHHLRLTVPHDADSKQKKRDPGSSPG